MTLIVALRAEDGVVLASDGQATTVDTRVRTRTETEKLDILHGQIAFGCAGSAGLRQRVKAALEDELEHADCKLPIEELRDRLHRAINLVQHQAKAAHVPRSTLDELEGVAVLLAGYSGERPWIYEVDRFGGDQEHSLGEKIGEGDHYAAYAIASADHYELASCNLRKVRMFAYRAIDDAIRTDASMLGPPIAVIEVDADGARRLDEDALRGVRGAVTVWQGAERELFDDLTGDPPGSPASLTESEGLDPPSG